MKKNVELYIDCRKEKMSNFLPSVKCFAMCLIKRYLRKTQGKIDFLSKTIKPTYLLTYLLIRAVKRFCCCILLESKSEKNKNKNSLLKFFTMCIITRKKFISLSGLSLL